MTTARASPCFRGPPVLASTTWEQISGIDPETWDNGEDVVIHDRSFGRCTVRDGTVYGPGGAKLATIESGISIWRPGFIDPYGLEVGVSGKQVLERTGGAVFVCSASASGSTCKLRDYDGPFGIVYFVAKRVTGDKTLSGRRAALFFSRQRVKSFHMPGLYTVTEREFTGG